MQRALALVALCATVACIALPASANQAVVSLPKTFPPHFQDPSTTWHVNDRTMLNPEERWAFNHAEKYLNQTGKYPIVYGYGRLGNATQVRLNETRAERARATLTAVAKLSAAENATAAALNFTSPLAGAESVLDQAALNFYKATNTIYNLTIGKKINATVYRVAVLPPRGTIGKVNVTNKVQAILKNFTTTLTPLGRKMLSHEIA